MFLVANKSAMAVLGSGGGSDREFWRISGEVHRLWSTVRWWKERTICDVVPTTTRGKIDLLVEKRGRGRQKGIMARGRSL